MPRELSQAASKVPEVTLLFWCIKIVATTLGETAGDALSMSMGLGYLPSTGIMALVFVGAVAAQVRMRRFHPAIYWVTIVATTTVGTTLADFADRSIGIGYAGGSALMLAGLLACLGLWRRTLGTVAVETIATPKAEAFYWATIMFSQTLGTALGDWTADSAGLGYLGAAGLFGGLLLLVAAARRWTRLPAAGLFWAAFVLTRPLGAVVGDFLDKPFSQGGLAMSRLGASAALLGLMAATIAWIPQRAARRAH